MPKIIYPYGTSSSSGGSLTYAPAPSGDTTGTTDLAALQALINAGPGVIVLRPGTYYAVGLVLADNVTLGTFAAAKGYIASGPHTLTTIKAPTGSSGWVIDGPSSGTIRGAGITGIDIDGNGVAGGIRYQHMNGCAIRRCNVYRTAAQGIQLAATAQSCVVEDVLINGPFAAGAPGAAAGAFENAGLDNFVVRLESSGSQAATRRTRTST